MADERRFVLRVMYGKEGRLRHLGHLDVMRTQERSIRRAGMPFALTQGFSPHMRCAYSAALPLGARSHSEYYDLSLTSYVEPTEAFTRLTDATPADLAPRACAYVDIHSPALGAWLDRSRWSFEVTGAIDGAALEEALTSLVAEGGFTYPRGRKEKKVDLTRTLVAYGVTELGEGRWAFVLDTRSSNEGALRPDVFVADLSSEAGMGETPLVMSSLERLGQWHEDPQGELQHGFAAVDRANIVWGDGVNAETL